MIRINNMLINVVKSGCGEQGVILLHGWGQSHKAFSTVQNHLEEKYTVYNIDLPGFGDSDKPPKTFNTSDYAITLKRIIDELNILNPCIIGHSFGGRVAIKYTSLYGNVKKLVLIDSAGIVPKRKFKYYVKVYYYKFLKRLFSLPLIKKAKKKVLGKFGSQDYRNADPAMRSILTNVVNEDLRNDLHSITCPTLLVWGTDDKATPISDAYLMKQYLKDSGIVEIKNGGHFSYLDNLGLFFRVLDVFLIDLGG